MSAITRGQAATHVHPIAVVLRAIVVILTLSTAWIHASLGGMLFMANAVGYTVLALAMIAPGPATRWRWLIRLALIGFAAMTIGGWVAFGPRFGLAYLDKAIEVALIGVLLVEQWQADGGPVGVYRRVRALARGVVAGTFTGNAR
jgi:hypothetical protein